MDLNKITKCLAGAGVGAGDKMLLPQCNTGQILNLGVKCINSKKNVTIINISGGKRN
jgi:hypothetical protein